jgi:protein TonB
MKPRILRSRYSLLIDPPSRSRRRTRTAASLLIHATLLFTVTRAFYASAVRVLMPGTQSGTRIDLTYNPGRAPVPTLKANPKNQPTSSPAPLLMSPPAPVPEPVENAALAELPQPHPPPLRQSSPVTNAPPAPAPDASAGTDSFGSGDVQIALTTYSPSPRPDLSILPHGTQGDVVLDVTIDPTGNVADLQILRALGYGIEDSVMQTVRTWKFHPAMRDGVAVASVQELHFHFGPA